MVTWGALGAISALATCRYRTCDIAISLDIAISYRGTSLIRNRAPLGPYGRTTPRALWGSYEGGRFLVGEVTMKDIAIS